MNRIPLLSFLILLLISCACWGAVKFLVRPDSSDYSHDPSFATKIVATENYNPLAPDNDECAGAIALTVNATATGTVTNSGSLENATESTPACIATGFPANDVWFKFVATSTTHRIAIESQSYQDLIFEVDSGYCGSLTSLGCTNNGLPGQQDIAVINDLTPGRTYYIRVYDYYGGNALSDFTICINTATTIIPNDECAGAIVQIPDVAPDFTQHYPTIGASSSGIPACFGDAEDDIWFTFTAQSPHHKIYIAVPDDTYEPVVEVFSGSCGSLVSLGCFNVEGSMDPSTLEVDLPGLTAGTKYYYRIYGKAPDNVRTDVYAAIGIVPTPPANDDCAGAIAMTPVTNASLKQTFSTIGATQSQPACFGTAEDDVWFKFTATGTKHIIRVRVSDNTYNPIIETFSGNCSSLTSLGCVNSSLNNPDSLDAELNNLVAGNTYYFRVYGRASNNVKAILSNTVIALPDPPANDDCPGAIEITPSATLTYSQPYTTKGATESKPGCYGTAEDDTWFSFTATTANNTIWVAAAQEGYNPVIELFTGNCSNMVSAGCYHGSAPSYDTLSVNFTTLVAGTTYYYRVYGAVNDHAETTISSAVVATVPIPNNDNCAGSVNVIPSADVFYSAAYSTAGATQSMAGCYGTAEDDIWFRFTAAGSRQTIRVKVSDNTFNPIVEVFSGSCGNLSSKGCYSPNTNNPDSMDVPLTGLTSGVIYYYRVYGKAANNVRASISTAVITLPTLPSNDECSGASLVVVNTGTDCDNTYIGNMQNATQSYAPCGSNGTTAKDVWLRFTSISGVHTITLIPGGGRDLVFEVFEGGCTTLNSLGCANTGGVNEQDTMQLTSLAANTNYYIRVYDKNGNTDGTSFALCVKAQNVTTGTIDPELDKALTVYPNPASQLSNLYFTIADNFVPKGDAALYDMNGRVIWHGAINQRTTSISTDQLQKGIYMLQLTINKRTTTRKVVVQ
ncbi:MAG: T9SS type A sorting domain-containing protein [Chitinophagaceae bacterium]